jgi:hypothetical protein
MRQLAFFKSPVVVFSWQEQSGWLHWKAVFVHVFPPKQYNLGCACAVFIEKSEKEASAQKSPFNHIPHFREM